MRRLGARRQPQPAERDGGAALVLVISSMMVLTMLALAALASTMVSSQLARRTQDYQAASAAAQAGVEEFVSRLNREDGYGTTLDCTNVAWSGPMTAPNPCGWTSMTPVGWVPVEAGQTDPDAAWFHYGVDASRKDSEGVVTLTSTGRVNGVYRTVQTAVGKGGSTDYVYYTDFESADPANENSYDPDETDGWSTAKRNACGINGYPSALYWWKKDAANRARSYYGCTEIRFTSGDVLYGEVRTNDTILSTPRTNSTVKPIFMDTVTTSDERCKTPGTTNTQWEDNCLRASSVADFKGKTPQYAAPDYLLDTSAEFAHHPGCHYFGSTRVIFQPNGRMKVWNQKTVNDSTAPVAIAGPDGAVPVCGTLDQLDSPEGADVPVPDEMVIYTAASGAALRECRGGELGGPAGRELPLGDFDGQAIDSGESFERDVVMRDTTKMCGRGNLYAEGVVKGRVTLAAHESVVVTGDLVLAGGRAAGSPDLLGLVATNSVEVFHPRIVTTTSSRPCNSYNGNGSCRTWGAWRWTNSNESEDENWPTRYVDATTGAYEPVGDGIQIAGSIQTLQHSFLVQRYTVGGPQGTLFVYGSIAQRWRGAVGQENTQNGHVTQNGYTKLYQYDGRLKFATPPYFPRWANSQWGLTYTGEIATPAHVRNG